VYSMVLENRRCSKYRIVCIGKFILEEIMVSVLGCVKLSDMVCV
jgi:hypothetical protein